jgi:hypothetical protein
MCRHLSFGSGRFEGTTFGTSFRNVEEKPGKWFSHISTTLWHPFCSWELGSLTIGVHANEEKTSHYDLAYAYLLEEKESDFENLAKHKKLEAEQNESFLVCDIFEFDLKKIFPDKNYIQKRTSYQCKNPNSRGATHMSATPSVVFDFKDYGLINIELSKNKTLYITRKYYEYYDNQRFLINSYDKDIEYLDNEIVYIFSSLTKHIYWKIEKKLNTYVLTEGDTNLKEKKQKAVSLTSDQLTDLASEDVWELPDFLQQ